MSQIYSSEIENQLEVENIFFSLDLQIPKTLSIDKAYPTNHALEISIHLRQVKFNDNLPKFGFVGSPERIFKLDLTTNNPSFNPENEYSGYAEQTPVKRVRIRTLEIQNRKPELPNYNRRNCATPKIGQLHASHCRNVSQETVDIIGDRTYQNRQFILQYLEERVR